MIVWCFVVVVFVVPLAQLAGHERAQSLPAGLHLGQPHVVRSLRVDVRVEDSRRAESSTVVGAFWG